MASGAQGAKEKEFVAAQARTGIPLNTAMSIFIHIQNRNLRIKTGKTNYCTDSLGTCLACYLCRFTTGMLRATRKWIYLSYRTLLLSWSGRASTICWRSAAVYITRAPEKRVTSNCHRQWGEWASRYRAKTFTSSKRERKVGQNDLKCWYLMIPVTRAPYSSQESFLIVLSSFVCVCVYALPYLLRLSLWLLPTQLCTLVKVVVIIRWIQG